MIVQFLCTTYCQIIKNNNYINGFIREPIRHIVINTKNNIDKKFINIIINDIKKHLSTLLNIYVL